MRMTGTIIPVSRIDVSPFIYIYGCVFYSSKADAVDQQGVLLTIVIIALPI